MLAIPMFIGGQVELPLERLDCGRHAGAEDAVHGQLAEEGVILRDAVQLPLQREHRRAGIALPQRRAGVALRDGLDVVESAVELSRERNLDSSDLIGECPAMKELKTQMMRVAATDANVLITGENGTGKDVVAHALHQLSDRARKPFVNIDLGCIPENLFESELFGYEKGAFTDAKNAKEGRIETADGGTLFLDEIGNLNLPMHVCFIIKSRC